MSAPVILPNVTVTMNAFTLRNSQISRPFAVTPAWKTLRVGVRLVMTTGSSAQTDITGTPRFTLGFSSGSNLYGDPTSGHFAGVQTNGYFNYASNAGSYNNSNNYCAIVRTLKKVGAVETIFNADIETSNTFFVHDRPTSSPAKCTSIFFDLTRPQGVGLSGSLASGSYTGSYWRHFDWTGLNYFTVLESEWLTQVGSASPVFVQPQFGVVSAGTFYINEVQDGYFDSVYVSWDREFPDPEIKITHMAVAVIA